MDNITIGQLSIAVAFIVALWKGLDFLIEKITKPMKYMQKQMDFNFKITYSLLQHEVTGNHITDMEKLLSEATDFMIKEK